MRVPPTPRRRLAILLCASAPLLLGLSACSGDDAPPKTPAPLPATAVPTAAGPTLVAAPTPLPSPAATPPPSPTPAPDAATLAAELQAVVFEALPAAQRGKSPAESVAAVALGGRQPGFWAVVTTGAHGPASSLRRFAAVYERSAGSWKQVARVDISDVDFIDPKGVQAVAIEPVRAWFSVEAGVGAHGGCLAVYSFDGTTLERALQGCSGDPGAGSVVDLNGDGMQEAVLSQTDAYVFCYACGVREVRFSVHSWDGKALSERKLAPAAASAAKDVRDAAANAMALANAGLWKDALASLQRDAPLLSRDPAAAWDVVLIRQTGEGRRDHVQQSGYKLLANVLYGDFEAAVALMRPFSAAQVFSKTSPLIVGTPAESWQKNLITHIVDASTAATSAKSDLAAAYFLRGWAEWLDNANAPSARADIAKAAQLAPNDQLYRDAAALLSK